MEKNILEIAKLAAKKAGDFLYQNFGNVSEIISKGDRNLATNLDKEAEKIIVDILEKGFPDHAILAEEDTNKKTDSDYLWIIDPLDGTHNYIRGIDIFGVSIGLCYKNDFIAGVVYMPKDKDMYYAEKGKGAYKNDKKIFVSNVDNIKMASGSFDSSIRYAPDVMLKTLKDVCLDCFNIRMLGSSARLLTYVAEGKLDFAVEFNDRPWDFAGSVCIILEAGGVFFDLKGKLPTFQTIGYIASNPYLYDKLKTKINF